MFTTQHETHIQVSCPKLESTPWPRAGISRSHAYDLMKETPPAFPLPVKIGRASRWVSSEIDAWIAARIAERDAKSAG